MKIMVAIALIGVALASPVAAETSKVPPTVLKSMQDVASKQLRDPQAARWQRLHYAVRPNLKGEPTAVVCGYVNAKNAYGGYIGTQPFAFLVDQRLLVWAGGNFNPEVVKTVLNAMCKGLI